MDADDDLDLAVFMEMLKSDELLLLDDLLFDDTPFSTCTPTQPAPTNETTVPAVTPPTPVASPTPPLPPAMSRRVKKSGGKRQLKFTVREEVEARLYGIKSKKSCLIDKLVRACYTKFGEEWVSWPDIKALARDVGFSPTSHVFRSVWPLVTCRYQKQPDGSVKVQETHAINFPYWLIDRTATCSANYKLRLAPEFFEK